MADHNDSDEEIFEDAQEIISMPSEMDLQQSIEDATMALNLFLNNKFNEALEKMKPWADKSMYHALGYGTIMYLQAVMTFEVKDIEAAMNVLKQSVIVCGRHRKKNTVTENITKMVKRPNYNTYTEVEIHAELCYAESLLERALLMFIQDENLVSFIKGGLKIRSCYQSYKESLQMLRYRDWPENSYFKKHFESGVRMGVGAFNLMISTLPAKILKILEFAGFSGNREIGLKELHKGQNLKPGLRGPLCAIILLAYHTVVTYFLGLGDGDLDYSYSILLPMLEHYPKGVLFLFFAGRIQEVRCNLVEAISWLEKAVSAQQEWKQFHHICFWELMWCHSFKCEWTKAAHYADLLLKESRWSKATYSYQKAAFLIMMRDELTNEQEEELNTLMNNIPNLKQRIAGKSIPIEKFAVKKAQRFQQQGRYLTVPGLELIYVWNGFSIIGKNLRYLDEIYAKVEKALVTLEQNKDKCLYYWDDYCLLQLLKGVCLSHMNSPLLAEQSLKEVWQSEKKLKEDTYLVPYALAELGVLSMKNKNNIEALNYLELARTGYKGYSLESRLHFRIHAAVNGLKTNNNNTNSGPDLTLGEVSPTTLATTPLHIPDQDHFEDATSSTSTYL